jgi:hypothetical protein
MRYLILLLLLSCTEFDINPERIIDPRLEPYVNAFYTEAAARGIILDTMLIARVEECGASGKGFTRSGQHYILINPNTYDYFTSGNWVVGERAYHGLENLVFHELGHALLNRDHCDPKIGIMSAKASLFLYAENADLRREFVDELFNAQTIIQ